MPGFKKISQPPPCHNCLTLPRCKIDYRKIMSYYEFSQGTTPEEMTYSYVTNSLYDKCSLVRRYLSGSFISETLHERAQRIEKEMFNGKSM